MFFVLSAFAGTTLAVLPFDNHSGDASYDALGRGIADMMVTDLARVGELELVERARIQDVLAEVKLGKDGFVDPESAARAGKGLGADFLVVGAINAVDPVLRIDTRVVDVDSGRITWTAAAEGRRTAFFEVEKDLVLTLLEEMEIEVSAREAMHVGRVATESFDALLDYSRGLQALDSGAVAEARERFRRAVEADGGFGAAREAIEEAKKRVAASDEVRDEAYSEGLKRVLPRITGYREGRTSKAELEKLSLELASQIHGFGYRDQRRIALAYLEQDLPETITLAYTPPVPVNAWAIQTLLMASTNLQLGDEVITWGQVFLERYPTSPYFHAQKILIDQQLGHVDKAQRAREDGVEEKLELEWEEKALQRRCDREPDQRRTLEPCRAFWTWKQEHTPDRWDKRSLSDILDGVYRHDPELAAEVLAFWTATLMDPPHSSDRGDVEDRPEDEARARQKLERVEQEPTAAHLRSAILAHLDIGDHAQADVLLRRAMQEHPGDPNTYQARWKVAQRYGDAEAMEGVLAEAKTAGHPIRRSHSEALERIERVREYRHQVDYAEAWRTFELADQLSLAGLHREAAERYEIVVERYPGWTEEARTNVLQEAAREWDAVFEKGALERGIALRKKLIAEHPDSREAKSAAAWIEQKRLD